MVIRNFIAKLEGIGKGKPVKGVFSEVGELSAIEGDKVIGWAFDPNDKAAHLVVEVSIDGVVRGAVTADVVQQDLVERGIGAGDHGFQFTVDPGLFDNQQHTVSARIHGRSQALSKPVSGHVFIYPTEAEASADGKIVVRRDSTDAPEVNGFDGSAIDRRHSPEPVVAESVGDAVALVNPTDGLLAIGSDGSIGGWAVDRRRSPAPAVVELLADDVVFAEVRAKDLHGVLSGAAFNEGRCAFKAPIPSEYRDGRLRLLRARVKDGAELVGSPTPMRLNQGRFLLHAEVDAPGRLTGWVLDQWNRRKALALEVWLDGVWFARLQVNRPATSVAGSPGSFAFPLPADARRVELRLPPNGVIASYDIVRDRHPVELVKADASQDDASPVASDPSDERRAFAALEGEQLFDAAWYLAAYPEAAASVDGALGLSPVDYWLQSGAQLGHSPNFWFDEAWYRTEYEDAAEAIRSGDHGSGFSHWLSIAKSDWRRTGAALDPAAVQGMLGGKTKTPLQAVRLWLKSLETPPQSPGTASTNAPKAGLRAVVEKRNRTGLIYDIYTRRLISDIEMLDQGAAADLKKQLNDNENNIPQKFYDSNISKQPLVSIIMPTFNRAYLIAEAIQSVLDQSWQNFELIVCDDGSTDKTAFVVDSFKDARIRYLKLEKSNGAIARNFGLKFSKGDYIAFLDSDNIWHPFFIELSVAKIIQSSALITYSGYIDTDANGAYFSSAELKYKPFDYQALLQRNYIDLNTIVLDRVVYEQLGGFDEALGRVQDWDLVLKYGRLAELVGNPIYTAFYRRNVAWGQVTNMQSHTNFNAIVGRRALERLSDPQLALGETAALFNLTVVAGSDIDRAREVAVFADLLGEVANVRLVLPQSEELEKFLLRSKIALNAAVCWRGPEDSIDGFVVGEAVIVAEGADRPFEGRDIGLPVLVLGRSGDQVALFRASSGRETRVHIGTPQIVGFEMLEFDDDSVRIGHSMKTVMIVAPKDALHEWRYELAERSRGGSPAILVAVDGFGVEVTAFQNGEETALETDETGVLAFVPTCSAVAILAPSAVNRALLLNIGVATQAAGRALVTASDPAFLPWHLGRTAHCARQIRPTVVLERINAILADGKGAERAAVKARRRCDIVCRRSAMADRLRLYLAAALRDK